MPDDESADRFAGRPSDEPADGDAEGGGSPHAGGADPRRPPAAAAHAADQPEIRRACKLLFRQGDVIELRALDVRQSQASKPHVVAGYFCDVERLANEAFRLTKHARGVYATLNPVNPALLARAKNRCVEYPKATASDADISARRWLMVDLDPARPSGISASNAEHEAALKLASRIAADLSNRCGWPRPIIVDSGNGAHLLYRIELPTADGGIVEDVLTAIEFQWSGTDSVIVDRSVFNAARLTRLAGTVNRKGDDQGTRSHRTARLIDVPDPVLTVSIEQLKGIASCLPTDRSSRSGGPTRNQNRINITSWLTAHGLEIERSARWKDGEKFVLTRCPWNPDHVDSSAYVVQFASGAVAAGCHHNSCSDMDWAALRDRVDAGWRDRKSQPRNGATIRLDEWSADDEATWADPVPLSHDADLPHFPTEALPNWLREWAVAEGEAMQVPVDLPAMMGLAVCSAAVAKKFEIHVKPGWVEPINLFIVIALPPGNRKSPVLRDATRPIHDREYVLVQEAAAENRRVESERQLVEMRLRVMRSRAAKPSKADQTPADADLEQLENQLASLGRLRIPQLLADDVTAERLASLLYENGGRMAVMSAEGGLFDIIAGRYSDRGGPNLDVLLKGHAGDAFSVDRVGRTREHVKRPALTLAFAIQPSVVQGLVQRPTFRGRGFLARFFYVLPRSTVGRRKIDADPVPMEIAENYRRSVADLLAISDRRDADGEHETTPLRMNDAARALLADYERGLEPRLGPGGDLEAIADWGAKLAGGAARVAGILALARQLPQAEMATRFEVEPADISAALKIADYLLNHAQAAFALMGSNRNVENAEAVVKWLQRTSDEQFSRRAVHQAMRNRCPRLAGLDDALRVLIEHGWIRPAEQEERAQLGRPRSPTFDVNPRLRGGADSSARR